MDAQPPSDAQPPPHPQYPPYPYQGAWPQHGNPGYPPYPAYPAYPSYPPSPGYPAYPPYPPYPPPAGWPAPLTEPSPQPAPQSFKRFVFGAILGSSVVSEPESTTVLSSPLLDAAVAFHRMALLRATWGFVWSVDGQGLGQSTLDAGNPMLSGVFRLNQERWWLRTELGVTAPAAHLPLGTDGRLHAFAYNQTMALWGMWNQWLWTPDRLAVATQASAALALAPGQWLVLDTALATMLGVRGSAAGSKSATVGQIAVEARLSLSDALAICPRWQTVLLPADGVDRWQSATGVRLDLRTSVGSFFAGFLVNLDEPLGIFGGLGRWGLHVGKEIDL